MGVPEIKHLDFEKSRVAELVLYNIIESYIADLVKYATSEQDQESANELTDIDGRIKKVKARIENL